MGRLPLSYFICGFVCRVVINDVGVMYHTPLKNNGVEAFVNVLGDVGTRNDDGSLVEAAISIARIIHGLIEAIEEKSPI